jgi:hypothetical protein
MKTQNIINNVRLLRRSAPRNDNPKKIVVRHLVSASGCEAILPYL